MQRENIATVPNLLTTSRIALTPYLGYLIVHGQYSPALTVLTVAAATDVVRCMNPI